MAQAQEVYATHDSTAGVVTPEPLEQYREAWADVKTPGNDRQYAVGTIEVRNTSFGSLFSGQPAVFLTDPGGSFPTSITLPQGQRRQVVMVQCTRAEPLAAGVAPFQDIVWQKYFYGGRITAPFETDRATNARGIAVWPEATAAATRIAICGETYDQRLPGAAGQFPAATAQAPTGFISVLDGDGNLLWTHHVFGSNPEHSCAITDVSIRVEPDGRETVTYCGISSHGDPGPGTTLSLELPAAFLPGAAGEWDGIVGRVSRFGGGVPAVEFHTNFDTGLGGREGLFGIAEVDVDYLVQPIVDRFVVVGCSTFGTPGSSGIGICFDASPTRGPSPGNDLVADSLASFGGLEQQTIARDVVVLRDGFFDSVTSTLEDMLAIVGSTDDPGLFVGLPWHPVSPPTIGGGTDGFVMMVADDATGLVLEGGQYFGGTGDDGYTGVQSWNEYPDQFVAAGFTEGPAGGANQDMGITSYYLDTSVLGASPTQIRVVRQDQIGGALGAGAGGTGPIAERPAGMGLVNATTVGLAFPTFGLDDPAGGGVAVDQRARVNVAGYTDAADFLGGFSGVTGRARDAALPADAVRVVFDMLPPARAGQAFGTGRTDLSGDQGPFVLPAGLTGGTTPACALSQFGRQIGDSAPILSRMLLDYEGDAPAANIVTNGALVVSRPTSVVFTAWQWDIPGAAGTPAPGLVLLPPFMNGVEVFAPNAFVVGPLLFAGVGLPGHSIRVPVNFVVPPPLPAPAMTVQIFCWFPTSPPLPGGLTCGPNETTETTASAAIWLPL
ncbi:MAG: hypothetical protein JNL08_08950 [Planctomycetes bacterium]|nr:hypothetical protein [Planctomycetota bacterium]